MLEKLYPGEYLDSTYQIDFGKLYSEGFCGVIFDIDNTLVPHGAPSDERSDALFQALHKMGWKTIVLSNNKEPRVKMFADQAGTDYIYDAGKPGRKGYLEAMEHMGTDVSNTVFVGDQIFTDIWGANRTGIRTILVKPLHPREEIQIVLKRYLEKIVLFFYQKRIVGKRQGGSK